MPSLLRRLCVIALCSALWPGPVFADAAEVTERLRYRLEVLTQPGELVAGGEALYAAEGLRNLYDRRGYAPVWFDGTRARSALRALPDIIAEAEAEGLTPADYHLRALHRTLMLIDEARPGTLDARIAVDAELLATDALLTLARHYQDGKVHPETVDARWFLSRPELIDMAPLLDLAASRDAGHIRRALAELLPQEPGYDTLRRRLALHRKLATDDWPLVGEGPTLRPGQQDARVALIRRRLHILGDLGDPSTDDPERYDDALAVAVRRFQARHGLEADAIVGANTRAQLNVTPQQRIAQIRANMARWRWLPARFGDEYILVNIAGYTMDVVSGGERVMRQRVIVGRPYRQTPVFTGNMTYLVLNPSWEVPHSIATRDLLPQIQADRGHLSRMGFTVLQGWGANERVIDPAGIDWRALRADRFPYRLRQGPGPQNALGTVKFMFPNRHAVYLHDTPARGLFAKEERAFSSGCIRVSDPRALTDWLLAGEGRPQVMSTERISGILAQGRETTVRLTRGIPVHLLYWTAWVEDDGQVHFRRDIYTRDQRLIEALDAPPPRA